MTDIDTRLRAARGLGKDETKASFESLRRRGHPQAPPPIASDGWGGITEAMIKVWGRIPPYRGRGRPPTRKLPGDDWQYLQMIKHRDKRGRLMEIEAKVVFGAEQALGSSFTSSKGTLFTGSATPRRRSSMPCRRLRPKSSLAPSRPSGSCSEKTPLMPRETTSP